MEQLGSNGRVSPHDGSRPLGVRLGDADHRRRFRAVAVDEVLGDAGRETLPHDVGDEHVEVANLPTGQRLPFRRRPFRHPPPVETVEARGDEVHDLGRHPAMGAQVPAHHGYEA